MAEKKVHLNNIDTAWWRMEDPTNLMMVTGIMAFAKPITHENLKSLLEKRLLLFDRFKQVVKDPSPTVKAPFWKDTEVDMDYHLIQESLAGEGGTDGLRQRTSELMSQPLDYSRPLWQIHLVDNVGIEGNAVIIRTHHCIADGMALVAVMLNLTASSAEESLKFEPEEAKEHRRLSSAGNIFRVAGKAAATLINTVTDREKIIDLASVAIAADQLGGAQQILDMSVAYCKEREQFGRSIASFQAIKHKLADMYISSTLARSNCYYGAWALSTDAPELALAAATARVTATQAYDECAKENIQTHGGMGFTWEFDCHMYFRRAKALAVNLGGLTGWQNRLVNALESSHETNTTQEA